MLHFIHADSGVAVPNALEHSVVLASSRPLAWDGVVAELGRSNNWSAQGLASTGHLLAMNLAPKAITLEQKGPHGYRRVTLPPGSALITPARAPMTHNDLGASQWGCVEISLEKVRRLLGHDLDVQPQYAAPDETVNAVARALFSEVGSGGDSGSLFADGMTLALVARLAHLFGVRDSADSGAAPPAGRIQRAIERVEDGIGDPLTVEGLAAIAGLSVTHFAREFKRVTREAPHAFVLRRRLERARQLLATGGTISGAASLCGFADQAHLSRMFKRRFGVTPGQFARLTRSRPRSST